MELWKECAVWLGRFKVISLKEPKFGNQAHVSDLVHDIRDGVILCYLVNSLDDTAVDMRRILYPSAETGQQSVSHFICRNNIFLFLHASISNFHLSMKHYFFQPEDLYLCRDLARVFSMLSALSYCAKFKKSGIPGFPKKPNQLEKLVQKEETLYAGLKEIYGVAETEYMYDSFSRNISISDNFNDSDDYSDIYQTICSPRQRFSLDVVFGMGKNKRQLPIQELIDTEDKYLENLIMVRDTFREPLDKYIESSDQKIIFYRLDDLISLHSDLLFGFKLKKSNIGQVMLRAIPIMSKLYGDYCVNLTHAVDKVTSLTKSDVKICEQIRLCQLKARPSTFPLSSHLVLPFQRFLKYHLLLREIIKATDEEHPEFGSLNQAADAMLKVGQEVNDYKREHEESEKQCMQDDADLRLIESVQQTIKLMKMANGVQLSDYGRLRKAGEIETQFLANRVIDYAFLFDKVLLLMQKPKFLQHRYRFRAAIRLRDYYLEPLIDSSDYRSIRLHRRLSPAPSVPYVLMTRSIADRNAWYHLILTAMDMVDPSENSLQKHVLSMTTFKVGTECFQCNKILQGKFYQGYRCLRCQAILHKACISACSCIEVGTLQKTNSMCLPMVMNDSALVERSGSTLSLAADDMKNSSASQRIADEQTSLMMVEKEKLPLEEQSWYAGQLAPKTATSRLESFPPGTFLLRKRANGTFAVALVTNAGVKHMCIQESEAEGNDAKTFFFSDARFFPSIQKLVNYYRTGDLTENFDYVELQGAFLRFPFKEL